MEARRGDGWVKLVGDWIDRGTGDLARAGPRTSWPPGSPPPTSSAPASRSTSSVQDGVEELLAAGVDGIEHGTGVGPEHLSRLAAAGVAVVPTLVNIATFPGIADRGEPKFPTYAAHMRALHARRYDTVAALHAAGVPVFAGTDAGSVLPHGLVVDELHELTAAGLSRTAALDAGVWAARRWLGHPGLEEGASADLLVVAGDPRADLGVLRDPTVVLRGRVVDGARPLA